MKGVSSVARINDCLLGLYEKALPADMAWDERLKAAKMAGYDFLEISIDESDEKLARVKWTPEQCDELVAAMRRQRLPILTMCLSGNRRFPIGSEDEKVRSAGIQLIRDAIDFSLEIGIRIVQLAGYDEFYGQPTPKTRALFGEALSEVTDYAASRGVAIAIETMDTDMMDSIPKVMRYVRKMDSPYLNAYPDVGNLTSMGRDIRRDFRKGRGHIVAIHLKDTVPGKTREIPYGQGTVDFIRFFRMLRRMRYRGLLVAEMWATDNWEASVEYVSEARNFLIEKYNATTDSPDSETLGQETAVIQ
jgi:predicted hexulose-6-phosphate isomerase